MATFIRNEFWTGVTANTAVFRNNVTLFESYLNSVGLVKVPSTGQIDLATFQPTNITPGTDQGWSIFRFNDTLQATAPIFIKFYYMSGGQSGACIRIEAEVGAAHNGQGTITDQSSGRLSIAQDFTLQPATITVPSYFHGGTGRFCMFGSIAPNNGGGGFGAVNVFVFGVERTRNAEGAYTNEGCTMVAGASSQYIPLTPMAPLPPRESRWHAMLPSSGSGSRYDNRYSLGVIRPFNGRAMNPLTIFGVGRLTEYSDNEIVAVDGVGNEVIYYRSVLWSMNVSPGTTNDALNNGVRILIRWD